MVNKMITLPYDMFLKLKEETNASALIYKLLTSHYRTSEEKPEEIESQIKDLKKEKKENNQELNESVERLSHAKKVLKEKEIETIEKNTAEKELRSSQKQGFFDLFLHEIGRKPTEMEWISYQKQLLKGGNAFSFMYDIKNTK